MITLRNRAGAPRARLGARRRARLVAGLLTPLCPDCHAAPGQSCDARLRPATELIRLSPAGTVAGGGSLITAHTARANAAIAAGTVSRDRLLAQFPGGSDLPALAPLP